LTIRVNFKIKSNKLDLNRILWVTCSDNKQFNLRFLTSANELFPTQILTDSWLRYKNLKTISIRVVQNLCRECLSLKTHFRCTKMPIWALETGTSSSRNSLTNNYLQGWKTDGQEISRLSKEMLLLEIRKLF